MTRDEILVNVYQNVHIISYCKSICPNDWDELRSQLIIQLIKMPDVKLQQAQTNNYLEYVCLVICKRIIAGRVKDSGHFYLNKKHIQLDEVITEDITTGDDNFWSLLDEVEKEIQKLHWYQKTLFNYAYKDGYKLREISEITGINIKSISYTINKTKKELRKKLNGTKYN